MICPKCHQRFHDDGDHTCPHCGESNARTASGVMRTSTILISAGQTDAVFRTVKEIPASLRKKLLRSTNSMNSATILIADRGGRQEIEKAIRKLPFALERGLFPLFGSNRGSDGTPRRFSIPQTVGIVLILLGCVLVWLVLAHRL